MGILKLGGLQKPRAGNRLKLLEAASEGAFDEI